MKLGTIGIVALCAASNAFAQPLADHVPADAALYVGWRGTTEPEAGYAGSRWETIVNESTIVQFVNDTLPAIGKVVAQRNPQQAKLAIAGAAITRELIRHTSAMYITVPQNALPQVALICQAGTDADSLKSAFDTFAAELPPEAHAATSVDNGIVTFSVDDAVAPAAGSPTLAALPAFKSAAAQVSAEGTLFAYVNVDAARDALTQKISTLPPAGTDQPNWAEIATKFISSSGLVDVHAIAMSETFKDKNWQTEAFLAAPSPRKGFVALGDFKSVDADLAKRAPAGAYMASQLPLDLEQVLTITRQVTGDVYPPALDMLDKGLGAATLAIGKNVESDLLQSLGGQWLVYTAPQIGGSSLFGTVLVNKLSNVLKAKQSIGALSIFLSNSGHTFTRGKEFSLGTLTTKIGDANVTYAALPVASPAWAIKDGYLYLGLYPQTVAAAANFKGDALVDSADCKTVMDALNQPAAGGGSFLNLPATFDASYGSLLLIERTIFGLSDVFAAPTPEPIIPPITTLSAQVTPIGSVLWSDDAGIHSRMNEPFPGAATIASLSSFDLSSLSSMSALPAMLEGVRGTAMTAPVMPVQPAQPAPEPAPQAP